ncbi:hypothetical protein [Dyella telluris]|uniref:Uncharacterized protein n=1 Tax=Dyella telluris TaxID=2763498 RepID=A0A7G8Q1U5_9GAMM|nr:hypothetical protein [Dyella telluris]QNK00753.1 hypothetical protein H8F01_16925 [Dyella telluris]
MKTVWSVWFVGLLGLAWCAGVQAQRVVDARPDQCREPSHGFFCSAASPEDINDLKDYITHRWRRVKATIDEDRRRMRLYLDPNARTAYDNEFNPSVSIPQYKQCADCEEFDNRITEIIDNGCHAWKDGSIHCYVEIRSESVPVRPANAAKKQFVSPVSYEEVIDPAGKPAIAIFSDGTQILDDNQPSMADCLRAAADGDGCSR